MRSSGRDASTAWLRRMRQDELLRAFPQARDAAVAGAVRSAGLIALRERELGLVDEGYGQRARALLIGAPNLPTWLATLLDIIDVLPASVGGITRTPTSDIDLDRARVLRANRDAWHTRLRELAPIDELAAYVWLAFTCGATESRDLTLDVTGRAGGHVQGRAAHRLQARHLPRHRAQAAASAARGRRSLRRGAVLPGQLRGRPAQAGRGGSAIRGSVRVADAVAEPDAIDRQRRDDRRGVRALVELLQPDAGARAARRRCDARQGARAHVSRANVEAIAPPTSCSPSAGLSATRVTGARSTRAQLEHYDEAWVDIEPAAKLLVNAEVPKLAGLIAYRRQQLEVSRAKFELVAHAQPERLRNRLLSRRRAGRTASLGADRRRAARGRPLPRGQRERVPAEEIAAIQASDDPPARKARQDRQSRAVHRQRPPQIATSWFNIAVAYYNLSRKSEARQFAEKVADDEQFGERARDLLSRLR